MMPPSTAPRPAEHTIGKWSAHLPEALIRVWQNKGFVPIAGGRASLIDPDTLMPIVSHVTYGDRDLSGDTFPVALGDFGELCLWSKRFGFGFLSPIVFTLEMPYLLASDPPQPDRQILNDLLDLPADAIESFDPNGTPLHEELARRFPSKSPMEIFGTTPAPAPLEGVLAEDYVIADAAEWLEAVYTEVRVTLVDWEREPSELRLVGPSNPDQNAFMLDRTQR